MEFRVRSLLFTWERRRRVWSVMELRNKEELRSEILQYWLRSAWVYPTQGPDDRTYLRLTPGGRLKMRRRISELEKDLGLEGAELAKQEEAGTIPVERDILELAMMVQAYDSERRLMQNQGVALGTPAVTLDRELPKEPGEPTHPDAAP
ncbi:MAG TPA: hypothetical protein VE568_08565 [Rubrobacter sp.]|nr:hypothetical protein [Rubrobacter sp.]